MNSLDIHENAVKLGVRYDHVKPFLTICGINYDVPIELETFRENSSVNVVVLRRSSVRVQGLV